MIPLLGPSDPFPPVERALKRPDGLLAVGADLSPERLQQAYRQGIYPWFSHGDNIHWWSPDPRMVLVPGQVRIPRSLAKAVRNRPYELRIDSAFREVMQACAEPRQGQAGTWIVPQMIEAYCRLHELGLAHSVEIWMDGELAGGLYGVALGRAFFGESMFSRARDASKIALVHLARRLEAARFGLIDCQMSTAHLASMGAHLIPRAQFVREVAELVHYSSPSEPWTTAVSRP